MDLFHLHNLPQAVLPVQNMRTTYGDHLIAIFVVHVSLPRGFWGKQYPPGGSQVSVQKTACNMARVCTVTACDIQHTYHAACTLCILDLFLIPPTQGGDREGVTPNQTLTQGLSLALSFCVNIHVDTRWTNGFGEKEKQLCLRCCTIAWMHGI